MGEKDNITLPYSLGFAATLTAAAVFSLSAGEMPIPSHNHSLNESIESVRSWEQYSVTNSSAFDPENKVLAQISSIQDFANNLLDDLVDIDPKIVKTVHENFWDILA